MPRAGKCCIYLGRAWRIPLTRRHFCPPLWSGMRGTPPPRKNRLLAERLSIRSCAGKLARKIGAAAARISSPQSAEAHLRADRLNAATDLRPTNCPGYARFLQIRSSRSTVCPKAYRFGRRSAHRDHRRIAVCAPDPGIIPTLPLRQRSAGNHRPWPGARAALGPPSPEGVGGLMRGIERRHRRLPGHGRGLAGPARQSQMRAVREGTFRKKSSTAAPKW